jgi:hypothetical protein
VQALEGLHVQIAGEGRTSVEEHRARLKDVLKAVKELGLCKADHQWLRRWLDRFGRYSLEERLNQLTDSVREEVKSVADLSVVPGDIPAIRNRLSHGVEDDSWQVLLPYMNAMSAIGVAHVLRLLDLPRDRIGRVLGQP